MRSRTSGLNNSHESVLRDLLYSVIRTMLPPTTHPRIPFATSNP